MLPSGPTVSPSTLLGAPDVFKFGSTVSPSTWPRSHASAGTALSSASPNAQPHAAAPIRDRVMTSSLN